MSFDPSLLMTVLLAFIQSATEFLPISSSAHLVVIETFGWTQHGIFSDVALHTGTLLAVVLYFFEDLKRLLFNMWQPGAERNLVRNLIVATIPILLGGCVAAEVISALRSPIIIASASIIFGVLLWMADRFSMATSDLRTMTIWDALCIGLAQLLAVAPGVSRSGITITCCRALGFSRRESTRFAMLLSIPAVSAASAYILWLAYRNDVMERLFNTQVLLGSALSAIMGLIVIRFLMMWVRRSSFAIFAIYRIIFGLFVAWFFLF